MDSHPTLGFRILAIGVTAIALVLIGFGSVASAQPQGGEDDEARRHFRVGEAHYTNGSFREAAHEFEEAYRLSQRPQLLYNVYVSYRDAGMVEQAARALRDYLARVPDAEQAATLRARLTSMEQTLAEQREREHNSYTGEGTTGEGATGEGTTGEGTTGEGARTTDQAVAPDQTGDASSDTGHAGDSSSTAPGGGGGDGTVGWVIAGVGGALALGGVITGVLAMSSQSSLESNCPDRACPPGYDHEGEASTGRALAVTADVLLITGAAAIAGGIVLGVVLGSSGGEEAAEHAALACDQTGCLALARGDF